MLHRIVRVALRFGPGGREVMHAHPRQDLAYCTYVASFFVDFTFYGNFSLYNRRIPLIIHWSINSLRNHTFNLRGSVSSTSYLCVYRGSQSTSVHRHKADQLIPAPRHRRPRVTRPAAVALSIPLNRSAAFRLLVHCLL